MRNFFTFILTISVLNLNTAQSNPLTHNLASSDYIFSGFVDGATTTYPVSMQGWSFFETPNSSNFSSENADRDLVNSSASLGSQSIRNEISNGISLLNNFQTIGAIVVGLNTLGRENISLTWTAEHTGSGGSGLDSKINGLQLQFRASELGIFTTVAGTEYLTNTLTSQNPPQTFSSITLPPSCNHQTVVQVRWIYYLSSGSGGNGDRIRLDDITITSSAILPVTFNLLDVKKSDKTALVQFSTASETNNDCFTIERSADGRSFDAIGEIKGAGNSSREISYTYIDEKPLKGINYYRIKQTDYDGKFSYSEIRSLRFSGVGTISLTPRTTEGRLDIRTELEDYTLAVYNTAGQEVKRFPAMSLDQSISIDELMSGIYFVRVSSGSEVETIRVVKI